MLRKLAAATLIFSLASSTFALNDPDSFGRNVKYLDVALSPKAVYHTGTYPCPADAVCRQITNPANFQTYKEVDRIVIDLPAASTNSLLCFSYTPYVYYNFANTTSAPTTSRFSFVTNATINSAALNDPSLINKATGLPFNGSIALPQLTAYSLLKTMAPNSGEAQALQYSRECINSLINTQTLQTLYGLTPAQAQNVMHSAMTVRFSTTTSLQNTSFFLSFIGVRLYGD